MQTNEQALRAPLKNFGVTLLKASELTPAKAREGLQLSGLRKQHGEKAVHGVVTALIVELTDFVECRVETSVLVAWGYKLQKTFWRLRLAEIVLAFDKGINGDFGKIYGALKYTDLVEWLNKYEALKSDKAIEKQISHKEGYDGDRQALQGIKKLIGKKQYNDKFN